MLFIQEYLKTNEDQTRFGMDRRQKQTLKFCNMVFISTGSEIASNFSEEKYKEWIKPIEPCKYWHVIEEATNQHLHAIIMSKNLYDIRYMRVKKQLAKATTKTRMGWVAQNNIN